jgi:transposase
VHEAVRHDAVLSASVTALLKALAAVEGQIGRLDERLKELARRSQVCWRLMSVPASGRSWRSPSWRRSRMSGGSGG